MNPGQELGGPNATGRPGDWVLQNREVVLVFDQLGSSAGFAESGGNLIDAADAKDRKDELGQVFTYFGTFPRQAVYERMSGRETEDGAAEIVVDGQELFEPEVKVRTIYRLGGMGRSLLITTTLVNRGSAPVDFALGDAVQWGGTDKIAPGKPLGFKGPSKGLYVGGIGRFASYAIASTDGDLAAINGSTWTDIGDKVVPALPGEAGFASSGTCIATHGRRHAWFVTGGASTARVIATTDGGEHWRAFDTPLRGSPSAGIFSVAFRDRQHGIIAGGDLDPSAPPLQNIATSRDGGASWTLGGLAPVGTVFGIAYLGHGGPGVVATGPGGTAWSADEGAHWTAIDGLTGYWAVAFANPHAGWVVGVNGTITKVSFAGGDDDDDRHDDD